MSDANPNSSLAVSGLLAYCRAGFEKELAAELDDIAADAGLIGFVRTEPNTGFAVFESFEPVPVSSLGEHTDWRKPVFARQLLPWFARVDDLPERDRATPIVEAVKATGQRFSGVVLETPDTDVAKQQSGFCKRFTEPLSKALEKRGVCAPAAPACRSCTYCSPARPRCGWPPAWPASAHPGRWASRACACRPTPPAARPSSWPRH